MADGFVLLHRRLTESELWFDESACRVFLWLLLHTNWKPGPLEGN